MVNTDTATRGGHDALTEAEIDLKDFMDALSAPRDAARCGSKYTYGRVCGLLRGHRTKLHRDCEVSWPDEKAIG